MKIRGRVWKFGKNVDTDVVIPAKYCNIIDAKELAKHCMEGIDPNFAEKITPGDIIVADSNFGCGSSREVAPLAIKSVGISCVVAVSFARIFFRNAINIGLPIFECKECFAKIDEGDELEIYPTTGVIKDLTKKVELKASPLPEFIQKIVASGGLINYVKERYV
jgi:3-isopropylmalate dehydratase small subunit